VKEHLDQIYADSETWPGEQRAYEEWRKWLEERRTTRSKQMDRLVKIVGGPQDYDGRLARQLPDDALSVYLGLALAEPLEEAMAAAEAAWHTAIDDDAVDKAEVTARGREFHDTRRAAMTQVERLKDALAELAARARIWKEFGIDAFEQPTPFDHHALHVVADKHHHTCMQTCTQYSSGKSGCRLRVCAPGQ